MKRLTQLTLIGFFLFTFLFLCSCTEDSLGSNTELSIPDGYINYFVEDLLVGKDSTEVKVVFQINRDWSMKVVYEDEDSLWCRTSPSSGEAGLNKVTIQIDSNKNESTRSAKIRLIINTKKFAEIIVKQENKACDQTETDTIIAPTDQIVLEKFWESKDDVMSVAAESYRLMADYNLLSSLIAWGEVRSDNVTWGDYTASDIGHILEANILPSNAYTSWNSFYRVINNCNIVLKYAPDVLNTDPDFTQGDLNMIRGEMLSIRALCHFYLIRTFRNIPLSTEAIVDNSQDLYKTQTPPIDALEQCLQDLYEAENLVLTSGNFLTPQDNKGRITKNAVRAIIADILLWKAAFIHYETNGINSQCNQCYEECITYCDLIINDIMSREHIFCNTNYPIMHSFEQSEGNSAYNSIFGEQNSAESIFELQCSNNTTIPYFYGREEGNGAMLKATKYLSQINENNSDGLYKPTDIRRASFINTKSDDKDALPITKYTVRSHSGIFLSTQPQLTPIYREVWDNSIESNWIIYRTSDVLLMKAEALTHQSNSGATDLEEAFAIVSAVYHRSNKLDEMALEEELQKPQDAQGMQALILTERQRELAFEGKRWYDLVRKALREGETTSILDLLVGHKYDSDQQVYRIKMSTIDHLFFPISEREMAANPNLKQNEAYRADTFEKN